MKTVYILNFTKMNFCGIISRNSIYKTKLSIEIEKDINERNQINRRF